ncbi:MAG TPA: hypothetical protein VGP07_17735 [Polyangia bacterium]|jgi:hypothetical protein
MSSKSSKLVTVAALGVLTAAAGTTLGCRHSHVSGTSSTATVLDAFKDNTFDVDMVKDVSPDGWSADHCVAGPVAGLEILVCEYETEQALAQGEKDVQREWDTVNVDTAVVLHKGRTMLAIADRAKKDLGGKTTVHMLNVFRSLP